MESTLIVKKMSRNVSVGEINSVLTASPYASGRGNLLKWLSRVGTTETGDHFVLCAMHYTLYSTR
jgi:hypothetical protein